MFFLYIAGLPKIPIRFWIAVMVFASTYINYTTRSNMSISITSMISGSKDKNKTVSIPECKRNLASFNSTLSRTPKPLDDVSIIDSKNISKIE